MTEREVISETTFEQFLNAHTTLWEMFKYDKNMTIKSWWKKDRMLFENANAVLFSFEKMLNESKGEMLAFLTKIQLALNTAGTEFNLPTSVDNVLVIFWMDIDGKPHARLSPHEVVKTEQFWNADKQTFINYQNRIAELMGKDK